MLGLVVTEMLLDAFPEAAEGELSRRLAELVRKETCAEVAMAVDLGTAIRVGGGARAIGILTTNVLGDVCEAVIGAIYLDGGYQAARHFVAAHWHAEMLARSGSQQNAKTALQEWAQGRGFGRRPMPSPPSRPRPRAATSTSRCGSARVAPARGAAASRREAEKAAATLMLVREGVWKASQ